MRFKLAEGLGQIAQEITLARSAIHSSAGASRHTDLPIILFTHPRGSSKNFRTRMIFTSEKKKKKSKHREKFAIFISFQSIFYIWSHKKKRKENFLRVIFQLFVCPEDEL